VGSPGPFRGRKRSLYEGGVRVPGIVRWPGRAPARVDSASVIGSVDFLPSMAKLAGVEAPAGDGEDRSGVLLGKPAARRKPLYWEWRFNIAGHVSNISPMLSMRDGDWKLMMNPDRSRVELYDIPRDPMEMQNRAGDKADVVARMSEKLLAWQKTLPAGPVDPGAGNNQYPWPK
jgi:N-acetylgalactosamine-6-sulfatase